MSDYLCDGQPIDAHAFTRRACDPRASAIVEACAGSGKTWLLVGRIVRLLLAGSEPGEILAITFTRRAAQEMRTRLLADLRALAQAGADEVVASLCRRGLDEHAARAAIPAARDLYERVLTARVPPTIETFHGWFWQLIARAPLGAGVPYAPALLETVDSVRADAWLHFSARLVRPGHAAARAAWEALIDEVGDYSARRLVEALLARRAEWWCFAGADADAAVARALAPLRSAGDDDPRARVRTPEFVAALRALVDLWRAVARPLKTIDQAVENARAWLDQPAAGTARDFRAACHVLLTRGTLTPVAVLAPDRIAPKLPDDAQARRYADAHAFATQRLLELIDAHRTWRALKLNEAAFICGRMLIDTYQRLKEQQQAVDFTDLEWHANRLLADPDHAAYMQARLDARYRHILLDEFQDTNPLQWQVLQSWLSAYDESGGRPTVFVVGDPKQSIYRFRRAEPRVFDAASELLARDYAAAHLRTNVTRRNARAIVEALNVALPGANPLYQPQSTTAPAVGAFVLLPLVETQPAPVPTGDEAELRDVLRTQRPERDNDARYREGRMIANEIAYWRTALPARWSDVLLLVRRRTHLEDYERALRDAGVPFVSDRSGGLLATLEADDLTALLGFLCAPFADLKLAHALRSPIFGCSDDDLMLLASSPGASWWQRLQALTLPSPASAGLRRDFAMRELRAAEATGACERPAPGRGEGEISPSPASAGEGRGEGKTASPALARARELLQWWLDLAGVLPVHDLLDRIYHEGDVRRRYAAVAPAALHAQVQANLDAFIELALQLDAGRYPSLPRFIDELAGLKRGAAEEAPDEGACGADDAVRVMTIHGAKGLEAEVVVLADAHARASADAEAVLVAWPPERAAPEHLSFVARGEAARDGARTQWFADDDSQRAQEDWNLLYVAATRARRALIVSGVAAQRAGDDTWYTRLARAQPLALEQAPPQPRREVPAVRAVRDFLPAPLPTGVRVEEILDTEAQRLGRAWHALLERGDAAIAAIAREHVLMPAQAEQIAAAAARVRKRLPHLFAHGALAELELVAASGELLRVDRLIEDDDALWIIDFKWRITDAERPQYEHQVRRYAEVLRAIRRDKPVRTGLVSSEGNFVEIIQ